MNKTGYHIDMFNIENIKRNKRTARYNIRKNLYEEKLRSFIVNVWISIHTHTCVYAIHINTIFGHSFYGISETIFSSLFRIFIFLINP